MGSKGKYQEFVKLLYNQHQQSKETELFYNLDEKLNRVFSHLKEVANNDAKVIAHMNMVDSAMDLDAKEEEDPLSRYPDSTATASTLQAAIVKIEIFDGAIIKANEIVTWPPQLFSRMKLSLLQFHNRGNLLTGFIISNADLQRYEGTSRKKQQSQVLLAKHYLTRDLALAQQHQEPVKIQIIGSLGVRCKG